MLGREEASAIINGETCMISIGVSVGSNPTLSATRDINSRGPGSVSSGSHEAGITPAREQRIDWDAAKRELRKDAE